MIKHKVLTYRFYKLYKKILNFIYNPRDFKHLKFRNHIHNL